MCASGGNAGLAAAYAAKMLNIPAIIVLPKSTPDFVADKLRDEVGNLIKQRLENLVANSFICLFHLFLYVPSTIFPLNRDGSSWVEPVLS